MNKLDKNGRSGTKIVIKLDQNYEQVGQKLSPSRIKPMNKSDKNCDQVSQKL